MNHKIDNYGICLKHRTWIWQCRDYPDFENMTDDELYKELVKL